jgi:hypothetical protein
MNVYGYRDGYSFLRDVKKQSKVPLKNLRVLADQSDPFSCGQPKQHEKAKWFLEIYTRYQHHLEEAGRTTTPHLRRIHYWLVGRLNEKLLDGKPYVNDAYSQKQLNDAARFARMLGYLDYSAVVDQKNPPPQSFASENEPWLYAFVTEADEDLPRDDWEGPTVELPEVSFEMPNAGVQMAGDTNAAQPYHIEIWVEKDTMDDVLVPICEKYGGVYVPFKGTESHTSIKNGLERIISSGKPGRLFYISDFDPAGSAMPRVLARHTEFMSRNMNVDIRVEPLILTKEQVIEYGLPAKVIEKDGTRGKEAWEDAHGGAVELDALEALHPGVIDEILTDAIEGLYDVGLKERYEDARETADTEIEDDWNYFIEPYDGRLAAAIERINTTLYTFRDEIEELKTRIRDACANDVAEIQDIQNAINEKIEEIDEREISGRPEPEVEDNTREWLFDSSREYFEQLNVYHVRHPTKAMPTVPLRLKLKKND